MTETIQKRSLLKYMMFKKYKTFSVLIYSYINTSGIGKTGSVFTKFRVFPISTSVDITVYQHGKNVLYFFYNIAQENTKLLQWLRNRKYSVFTSSYANTAINQSAFRILKCYIIMSHTLYHMLHGCVQSEPLVNLVY